MSRDSSSKPLPAVAIQLLLVLLFVIWSNAFTAIRHLREIFEPMDLVLARFLPVAIFCSASIAFSKKRRSESLEIVRKAPLRIAAMSLFGVAGYNYFLYIGQSEIKPGAAALLTTLSPLFTMILAVILLRERVPPKRILGIILAFAGIFFVVKWGRVGLGHVTRTTSAEQRYALITALAPLCWSLYTVIGKDIIGSKSSLAITYTSLTLGTLPLCFMLSGDFFHTLLHMGFTYWIALVHLSALCTVIGFWIWFTALKYLPATSVSSFIYLNPPFAALFGRLFFKEEVTTLFLLGSAVVICGLYLAQLKNGAERCS